MPVRTNIIPKTIPDQMWYTHPLFAIALGGILPFGAVCIELFFIMSALWLHQVKHRSTLGPSRRRECHMNATSALTAAPLSVTTPAVTSDPARSTTCLGSS